MILLLKYFYDNLNIIGVLAPAREFPLLNVANFL